MDLDKTKIESLEAELARIHIVAKKSKEALAAKEMALVTIESWWHKLVETLASFEHHLNKQQCILPYTLAYNLFTS